MNSKRVAPSLRRKQLRHFNKGQAVCNSGAKAHVGILYRLAPFGTGPRGAVARNDVMLRPVPEPHALSHPCKWCSPIWLVEAVGSASSHCDLSSKEATQSLAPLLLGCLGQATLDCVLNTVIWQNLSNKETNPILTDPTTKQRTLRASEINAKPIKSHQHQYHHNSKLRTRSCNFCTVKICNAIIDQSIFASENSKNCENNFSKTHVANLEYQNCNANLEMNVELQLVNLEKGVIRERKYMWR